MQCRPNCGACCTEISISSFIPGMPNGKPAGTPCIHLNADLLCELFGRPERPKVCSSFAPEPLFCGESRQDAIERIQYLEISTKEERR